MRRIEIFETVNFKDLDFKVNEFIERKKVFLIDIKVLQLSYNVVGVLIYE